MKRPTPLPARTETQAPGEKVSLSPRRRELLETGVYFSKFQFAQLYYSKSVNIWALAKGYFLFIDMEEIFQETSVAQRTHCVPNLRVEGYNSEVTQPWANLFHTTKGSEMTLWWNDCSRILVIRVLFTTE